MDATKSCSLNPQGHVYKGVVRGLYVDRAVAIFFITDIIMLIAKQKPKQPQNAVFLIIIVLLLYMDNSYLQELIIEANSRGGGMILNLDNQPAVVVLTVDKYNELLNRVVVSSDSALADQTSILTETMAQAFLANRKVLVTGGAGFIGSHAARELLRAGYEVVVLDNLSAGVRENVPAGAKFVEGDLADLGLLRDLFAQEKFDAVIHFAASIEVEESVREPEKYFENNVLNTAKLLQVMNEYKVKRIVFSSTCAVYGEQAAMPISETAKVGPVNPYGYSKLIGERIIKYYAEYLGFRAVVFRYFNACGCNFDGDIKPTHKTHLFANVMDVAVGKKPSLTVFGNTYDTFDGTCIRDYVHVLDIAQAHITALEKIDEGEGFRTFNIGTGRGSSVLEVVNQTSEVLNKIIPMELGEKRAGDAPVLIADKAKLKDELGYELQYSDLETIITTSWTQAQNFK